MITATPLGAMLACLMLVAGCSDGDGGESSAEPPTRASPADWQPTPGLCQLLTDAQRAELLGLDDPRRLRGPQRMSGRGCAWIDRRHPDVQLVLVSMPTTEWVKDLPAAIDVQLAIPDLSAADRADLEAMRAEVEALSADDTEELCDFFGRLAAVQGYPDDSTTAVYVTRGGSGLSAQHCADDTFTSLVGRSVRISGSKPLFEAYRAAIEKVAAAR